MVAGPTGAERGANVLAPGSDLSTIAAIFHTHAVPSLFTPGGWYRCGNRSAPLVEDWRQSLDAAAASIRPFIANGSIVGIFYGDEISCTCDVPFWAVDAATSYMRGVLGEADGLIHFTNECMNTLGCE